MPGILDTFRFTANDGSGDTVVVPTVRTLRKRYERQGQEERTFRTKLANPLLFRGAHYDYFRTLYDAGDCTEVTLLIERYCAGDWEPWYLGIVPIRDGDYNASRCEVSFEIIPDDVYTCSEKEFGKKSNWLDYSAPTEIKTFFAGSEQETYTVTVIVTPTLTAMKWAFTIIDIRDNPDPDPVTAFRPISNTMVINPSQTKIITTLAREKVTAATSPGPGWIDIGGGEWARPPIVGNIQTEGIFRWEAMIINPAPISNGRSLAEALEEVVEAFPCGIDSVVSNFLNINPDATAPDNDAYTYAEDNLHDLFYFQKSDIVRATASNDATRLEASLKDVLEDLRMLNVWWAIVKEAGTVKLRIEHYTYFTGTNGLNLVTYGSGRYIVGHDRFKSKSQVPAYEEFSWQESFRSKFLTQRIDYPLACANTGPITRSARIMCADFGGLVENNDAGLEGMFLMAAYPDGSGGFLLNTLGGEGNGALAWHNVLPALWADGRFHADATATVDGYAVVSVRKTRQQGQIVVKWPCSEAFEPSQLVNTQLGWGEVEDAEEDAERCTLKLNLLQ